MHLRILLSIINKIHNICKICCSRYNYKWNAGARLLFLQPVIHLQTIDQYTYCSFDTENCTVFTDCIYTFPASLILSTFLIQNLSIGFNSTNKYTNIHHNTASLYNVYSYMFRRLCVFLKDFQQLAPRQVK